MKSFKEEFSLSQRQELFKKESYMRPNKTAVIVEAHRKSHLPLQKYLKFMASNTYSIATIAHLIKKDLMRSPQSVVHEGTSLYFFCQQKLLKQSDELKDIQQLRDPQDGFLYLTVALTQTF